MNFKETAIVKREVTSVQPGALGEAERTGEESVLYMKELCP